MTPAAMSYDEAADKFRGCAVYAGFPEERAGRVIETVRRMEDVIHVNGGLHLT